MNLYLLEKNNEEFNNMILLIIFRVSFIIYFGNVMLCLADSSQSLNYQRRQILRSGRRMIPPFSKLLSRHDAFPEPLPSKPKPKTLSEHSPYRSLYQGARKPDDKRVYRDRFEFSALPEGQLVTYDEMFDCPLSFLAVETDSNIPIVLRGGVGYRFFTVVIKSKPNDQLKGQVRAFCVKTELDYYKERQTQNQIKLYIYPDTSPATPD